VAALNDAVSLQAFFPEPTSAAAFAAVPKLQCEKSAQIVVINTGSGLRYIQEIAHLIHNK